MDEKFIVLTHELIRDSSMTMQEKIIYMEILNLSSLDKGCIASNAHFEKSFGISKKSVSNTISSLVAKGMLEVKISDRNHTRILSIKNGGVSIKNGGVSIKNGESKENRTINNTINRYATLIEQFKSEANPISELTVQTAEWFINYRKTIKKPVKTLAPIKLFIDNVRKCINEGYKLDDVLAMVKDHEWQSVKLEWVQKEQPKEKGWSE